MCVVHNISIKMANRETSPLLSRVAPPEDRLERERGSLAFQRAGKLIFLTLVFFILYLIIAVLYSKHSSSVSVPLRLGRGTKIHIASSKYNYYLRVSSQSLALTETIPWLHGSTFEAFYVNGSSSSCYRLRTMYGTWLRADGLNGVVSAESVDLKTGTLFESVRSTESDNSSNLVQLKVCNESTWLQVSEKMMFNYGANATSKPNLQLVAVDRSKERRNYISDMVGSGSGSGGVGGISGSKDIAPHQQEFKPALRTADNSVGHITNMVSHAESKTESKTTESNTETAGIAYALRSSTFRVEEVQDIRGVNLGGWFIPEIWMTPSFSNYTGLHWSGSLCK